LPRACRSIEHGKKLGQQLNQNLMQEQEIMEISPIINLTRLPLSRPLVADLGLPPMERIENSSRTGDETYSPSEGRSADDSDDTPEELDADEELELKAQLTNGREEKQINFFA
jgi:hypothetical protein